MKKAILLFGLLFFVNSICLAQESGNSAYRKERHPPQKNTGVLVEMVVSEANGRQVYYAEANVAMNMKADEYVAVFGLMQEAPTAAESNSKVNLQAAGFVRDLENLGIKRGDIFIDFITQNKVYDYTRNGTVITEKLSGFETKKNVAVRYKDRELLEKITSAAAKDSIFDLIKVDYIVNDIGAVRARLLEEAVKIVKQKEANYLSSFGIKLSPTNFVNEKYDAFYPGELYASYQAFEAGDASGDENSRIIQQRKTKTFYYEPLDPSDFDSVINPLGIEPMVQFTLYLRMQYDLKKQ
jgi:uncharacterized protein YggE